MTKKRLPQKPSSPLGVIKFLPNGVVHKITELLPETKDDLERAIVNKFVVALAHFENRHIQNIRKADPWPDFEGQELSNCIGIEVVELVNPHHNALRKKQQDYKIAILERLGDNIKLFDGLEITLNDNYQVPPYPRINSVEGQAIVNDFVQNLLACADEISSYEVKGRFIFEWQVAVEKPNIGIYGYRFAPKDANIAPHIGFLGTFPESVDKVLYLLAEAIQHKIGKSYTYYSKGRLVLLVYEVGTISVGSRHPEAILRAQDVLEHNEHHFDEVWYIFPHPESNSGILYKVWPKSSA